MSANSNQLSLPLEIILNVIDFILPTSKFPPIALPLNHPTTRTLLALTRTSRSIYPTARRLLYTHCMYINTTQRLLLLLGTLKRPPPVPLPSDLRSAITSLYLRPFPRSATGNVGDTDRLNIGVALQTRELLYLIRSNLRRLVVDMPLLGQYPPGSPNDNTHVRFLLRVAFNHLPNLEEFCSIRDELYLPPSAASVDTQPEVWNSWPKVKTLALHRKWMSNGFLQRLRKLEHLETVVLTRCDALDTIDLQQGWNKATETEQELRPLNLVLVNVERDHPILRGREDWKENNKLKVKELNVPISYYGDEDCVELCQHWIKRKFLAGEPISG